MLYSFGLLNWFVRVVCVTYVGGCGGEGLLGGSLFDRGKVGEPARLSRLFPIPISDPAAAAISGSLLSFCSPNMVIYRRHDDRFS